jgi:ABC-2 type transport system ATP-binding protein
MLEISHITKDFTPPFSFNRVARLDFSRGPVVRALNDVSLSLKKGSILAVLGPNGAGKTTLLKIIATLILPDRGTVAIDGFFVGKDDDDIRSRIGIATGAERSFYWRLTGRQNLEFFASMYGLGHRAADARIRELLALLDITYEEKRFDSYSAGMQQKFGIARALIHDPEVLLLDEPTKSLDRRTACDLMKFLRDASVKHGKAIIFTTHHIDEACELADNCLVLGRGNVVACGSPADLRREEGFLL